MGVSPNLWKPSESSANQRDVWILVQQGEALRVIVKLT